MFPGPFFENILEDGDVYNSVRSYEDSEHI